MPRLIRSNELALELLDALRIPSEGVMSVQLDLTPGKAATVTVESYVSSGSASRLARTLSRYGLVLLPQGPEKAPEKAPDHAG